MFEQQPDAIRQKVKLLATEALQNAEPSAWFEVLYKEASGDAVQVPWAKLLPHPYLQNWLESYQPQTNNHKAIVIGCGLGDDAEALAAVGFSVTAFDISPTAIAWCKQRFPNSSVNYTVADLFNLPNEWQQGFDFVFESRNIQALPLSVRPKVISAIAQLVAINGTLLLITRIRDTDTEPDGPPWALSNAELSQFQQLGLPEIRRYFFDEGIENIVKHARIEYLKTS